MDKEIVTNLIKPLFLMYEKEMTPASETDIEEFVIKANSLLIPNDVVNELCEFYRITNGVPCLDGFDFHCCNDGILYEWWDKKIIWLGQRDDYVITWYNNKYCLGDSSNISFSKEFEFNDLMQLINKAVNDWFNNYL